MKLTPHELRTVEFRERWRGYDPDEVDDFLERLAAGLEQLNERGALNGDAAVQRTLVLAQRTAEAAVAEADERARAIIDAALEESRRIAADRERPIRDDIASLEAVRDALQAEIDGLERRLEEERDRVRAVVAGLAAALDQPFVAGPAAGPEDTAPPDEGRAPDAGVPVVIDLVAAAADADDAGDDAVEEAPGELESPGAALSVTRRPAATGAAEPVDWRALAHRLRKRLLTG